ncbi:LysE family translocator [Kribbella deserti]|uniref:LysE family translocator n=1 Tax=Kribbella deserti TaxID=1926257 RepID=A0ABV6QP71_9ACTN
MDASILVAYVLAAFLIAVVPGPDMPFIVANAMVGGGRAGVVAAAGMSTGLAVHTLAAALGLAAMIQAAPEVLTGVRIAGVAFLLYLAVMTWRSSRQPGPDLTIELPKRSLRKTYLMATLTNLAAASTAAAPRFSPAWPPASPPTSSKTLPPSSGRESRG